MIFSTDIEQSEINNNFWVPLLNAECEKGLSKAIWFVTGGLNEWKIELQLVLQSHDIGITRDRTKFGLSTLQKPSTINLF